MSSFIDPRFFQLPTSEIRRVIESFDIFLPEKVDREFLFSKIQNLPSSLPFRKEYSGEDVIGLYFLKGYKVNFPVSDVLAGKEDLIFLLHQNHCLPTSEFIILEQPIFRDALKNENFSKEKILRLFNKLKEDEKSKDDFSRMSFRQIQNYFIESGMKEKKILKLERRSELYDLKRPTFVEKKKEKIFETFLSRLASLGIDVSYFDDIPSEEQEDFEKALTFLRDSFDRLDFAEQKVNRKNRLSNFEESYANASFLYNSKDFGTNNQTRYELARYPPGIYRSSKFVAIFQWQQFSFFFDLSLRSFRKLLVHVGFQQSEIENLDFSTLLFLLLRGKKKEIDLKNIRQKFFQIENFLSSLSEKNKNLFLQTVGEMFGYTIKQKRSLISFLSCLRFSPEISQLLDFLYTQNYKEIWKNFNMIPFYSERDSFEITLNCLPEILLSILEPAEKFSDFRKLKRENLRHFSDLNLLLELRIQPVYSSRSELLSQAWSYLSNEEDIFFFVPGKEGKIGIGNSRKSKIFNFDSIPKKYNDEKEITKIINSFQKLEKK